MSAGHHVFGARGGVIVDLVVSHLARTRAPRRRRTCRRTRSTRPGRWGVTKRMPFTAESSVSGFEKNGPSISDIFAVPSARSVEQPL